MTVKIHQYVNGVAPPPKPLISEKYIVSFTGFTSIDKKTVRAGEQRRWSSVGAEGHISLRDGKLEATGLGAIGGPFFRNGKVAARRVGFAVTGADSIPKGCQTVVLTGVVTSSTYEGLSPQGTAGSPSR